MNIPFSPPDITDVEVQEVVRAMQSGWITTGPRTKLFEQKITEYCGTAHTVCLNSATAALELVLRVLGIGPGDEVITSAYTYTASASIIHHVGAKIILVDVAPGSYQMDIQKLANAITERTKAIIPVDIGGVLCDYDALYAAVESKKRLYRPTDNAYQQLFDRPIVVEDAAHSFGAMYHEKKAGQIADLTCFSFHAVKNLTTAEGGAITWLDREGLDNDALYTLFMLYALHGQTKDALTKMTPGAWEYDIVIPGYKCNMTDISAAIGLAQLERFDGLMERRKQLVRMYNEALSPLEVERLEHFGKDYEGNGHLYMLRVSGMDEAGRNEVIVKMAKKGVACNVHFKPLAMFTGYKQLGFTIENYMNTFYQYQNEITLPLHTSLSDEEVIYVADSLKKVIA